MWYLLSTSKKNSSGNQKRTGCFVITVTASSRAILPYRSSIVVAWDIHGVFTGLVAVYVDKVPHSDILIFYEHCVTHLLKVSKIREDTLRSDGCLVVPCNRLLVIMCISITAYRIYQNSLSCLYCAFSLQKDLPTFIACLISWSWIWGNNNKKGVGITFWIEILIFIQPKSCLISLPIPIATKWHLKS